jgi:hypothetical protein
MEHDLFGKPGSTFPDHALAAVNRGRPRYRQAEMKIAPTANIPATIPLA